MSHMWHFSPSSQPFIQRLLQVVNNETDNKWTKKFKHVNNCLLKRYRDDNKREEHVIGEEAEELNLQQNEIVKHEKIDKCEHEVTSEIDESNFCEIIVAEPHAHFEYMIEECLKYPCLISKLAEKLPINIIEKICNLIFNQPNPNSSFVNIFFQRLYPVFLKRENSWLALDLLTKTYKTYPNAFTTVFTELIKSVEIPNQVLQELVKNCNGLLQKDFIHTLINININSAVFKHHLFTIYTVYSACPKTETIQKFIQSKLVENAETCTSEKDYGRLFLSFLQSHKSMGTTFECEILERLIEIHRSPFKRPCLNILKEIAEKQANC